MAFGAKRLWWWRRNWRRSLLYTSLRIEKFIKNSKVNNFLFRMACIKNWIMKIKLRHLSITYIKYFFYLESSTETYREIYIIRITIKYYYLNVLEMLLIFQGRDVLILNYFFLTVLWRLKCISFYFFFLQFEVLKSFCISMTIYFLKVEFDF